MKRIEVYLMSLQFSAEERQKMEHLIDTFFEEKNIKRDIPVDIFKVATGLGFDIRGAEFEEKLDGIIIVNEHIERIDGFDSNKVIAYNCSKDINAKKFIVAHELAHYIYQKANAYGEKIVVAARDHTNSYSEDLEEQKMDYIAAGILIPHNDLNDFMNNGTNPSVLQVANRYNVPEKLAQRRIEEVST